VATVSGGLIAEGGFAPAVSHALPDAPARSLGRWLCLGAVLLASGDLWPTINIGFTFRISQILVVLALVILLTGLRRTVVRTFPGARWLYAFLVWAVVSMPLSIYPERSLGYTCWLFTDVAIIFVFAQYFDSEAVVLRLLRWFLISFSALAIFGLLQLALGIAGINLFVSEWWIAGRLPRINGLSYEPSYYASYLIVGWVLSLYLLEHKSDLPSRRVQKWCATTTTIALILSSSRMGWIAMVIWMFCRGAAWAIGVFVRHRVGWGTTRLLSLFPFLILGIAYAARSRVSGIIEILGNMKFLVNGLGLFGTASHSSDDRLGSLAHTWQAFVNHPLVGAGLGALPVDIAGQQGAYVSSLADAKSYEGGVLSIEILASTGLIGMLLMSGFVLSVFRYTRVHWLQFSHAERTFVSGLNWGIALLMLLLHFNGQFLRVYIYIDIAVLLCCVAVFSARGGAVEGRRERNRKGARPTPVESEEFPVRSSGTF
jgi:hypothetical protein